MRVELFGEREFLLGIEESWDSYKEVTVRFVDDATIAGHTFHIFRNPQSQTSFYLRPRYEGHRIAEVLGGKVVVSIYAWDPDSSRQLQPRFYATGLLQLARS